MFIIDLKVQRNTAKIAIFLKSENPHILLLFSNLYFTMKNTKSCNICGKTYLDFSILQRHINSIHGKHKDHKCDLCGFEVFGYNILSSLNLFFLKSEF